MTHTEPKAVTEPVPRIAFKQFEAAAALGISRWVLRREVNAGSITPMPNGNYALAELQRYANEQTEKNRKAAA